MLNKVFRHEGREIIMKKILLVILAVVAGYQIWGRYIHTPPKNGPLYELPYVVVYGRDSCGYTQKTLRELSNAEIPFEYKIVDDKVVANELHTRMEASDIDTRFYYLPVVDVNNRITIRPSTDGIIEAYESTIQ